VTTPWLIDSCVLIDVLLDGPWTAWSSAALGSASGATGINTLIIAEVGAAYRRFEDFRQALPVAVFPELPIPAEAAFLAGQVHGRYRQAGGTRDRTLPDFLIGAHAAVAGLTLVTRDPRRYRRHFPRLALIAPDSHFQDLAPQG
jgi:predicted nucleic acid-binding protein